jgi:hypothetical protein
VTFDQLSGSGSESGSGFKKLDPDSDTDSDPEEYSFCIAVRTGVTGQKPGVRMKPLASVLPFLFAKIQCDSSALERMLIFDTRWAKEF